MKVPEALRQRIAAQKHEIPAIYGQVDFDITPERFTVDPAVDSAMLGPSGARRAALLANTELVGRIRAYTMLGDNVADAYAALMPEYGFRRLVAMLTEACDRGVEAVDGAPPELVRLIRAMEATPDWLDMKLVEEGARFDRNISANLSPWAIRGAFIATFLNKYAALPMALTGTLSNDTARRRVFETATFFTVSVLPGALERFGPGFKAAAMVRLMHSMVRFNALRRGKGWDIDVYGIPIPQVDQMPAGMIGQYLISRGALAQGRTTFNADERARIELARYRCFLLGLPLDLLPDNPKDLVDTLDTRSATLRGGFDDATCGALLRATMAANLAADESWPSRLHNAIERGFSKVTFVKTFLGGNAPRAAQMGVTLTATDWIAWTAVSALVTARLAFHVWARRRPGLREFSDRVLIARIRRLLDRYGHAEFVTNADAYRPAVPKTT